MEVAASHRVFSANQFSRTTPTFPLPKLFTTWNASLRSSTTSSSSSRRNCYCLSAVKDTSAFSTQFLFSSVSFVSLINWIEFMWLVLKMAGDGSRELELSNLTALSPLDGRYWSKVKDLSPYLSEYGLIYYRVLVEIKWLLKLSQIPEVLEVASFSQEAESFLQEVLEFSHFACTSEDINNLAHALMLKESMNEVVFPVMNELINATCKWLRTMLQSQNQCFLAPMVNEFRLSEDLNQSWEVLAEPIENVMCRYGVPEPYEKLKELTRGRAVTRESMRDFIGGLALPKEAKAHLLKMTPNCYVGAAIELGKTVGITLNLVNGLSTL